MPRLDVSALLCPMTWVRTKLALEKLGPGERLEVVLGPGEMLSNLPRNAREDGHEVESLAPISAGRHLMIVRKRRSHPMVSVRIPTPLRAYAQGHEEVQVEGASLKDALDDLDRRHPGFKERLLNDKGALRPYINVFLNDEDVRFGAGLASKLEDGDRLTIVPAIAGGC